MKAIYCLGAYRESSDNTVSISMVPSLHVFFLRKISRIPPFNMVFIKKKPSLAS